MKKYSDLEYLKLSKGQKLLYKVKSFFCAIPQKILGLFVALWNLIKNACTIVKNEAVDIWSTFVNGDWKTKVSFLVMGFGNLARGQILRGLLFLLFEVVFIGYMILAASPDDQYRPHGPPGGLSIKHILTFSSCFLPTSTLS